MQFKTATRCTKLVAISNTGCLSNIALLLFEDVPQSSDLTASGLFLQHLGTSFLLRNPDQGAKHFSATSAKEENGITQNKTCDRKKPKKDKKRLWNIKQEKNLTFSWGEEVLSSQKSLFLLFKIGDLRWTVVCSLLCVCCMVIFYGAESEGAKSLWGTDSPLNLQKNANTFHSV